MNMKPIYIIVLFVLSFASSSLGQTFCLSFANQQITNGGTKFEFDIFITRSGPEFHLGSSNLVFNFNNLGISTPVLLSHTLSGSYDVPTVTNPLPNRASFNVVLNNDNNGIVVNDTPTLLGRVQFSILNPTLMSNINWLYTGGTTQTIVFNDVFPGVSQLFATTNSMSCLVPLNSPLPVDLININASSLEKSIRLDWKVAQEQNLSNYEVQRKSDNNTNFSVIGDVIAMNKNSETQYNYIDENVERGIKYFYRLRMIDFDGSFSFSPIVFAKLAKSLDKISVYPNPIVNNGEVRITADEKAEYVFVLYDSNNKYILSKTFEKDILFRFDELPAGVYYYKINHNSEFITGKLVVL